MKLILSGWQGSQKVVPASAYLIMKYLGNMFDIEYACNTGDPHDWSNSVRSYLSQMADKYIILGVDDMLLSGPIDKKKYEKLLSLVTESEGNIICAKLCTSDFHGPSEYDMIDEDIMILNNTAEFSAVGQYCLWNRVFLMELLSQTTDAWQFEGEGSRLLNATGKKVVGTKIPTIPYPDRSSMSRSWPGKIRVTGNPKEDIDELLEKGLLQKEDLLYD